MTISENTAAETSIAILRDRVVRLLESVDAHAARAIRAAAVDRQSHYACLLKACRAVDLVLVAGWAIERTAVRASVVEAIALLRAAIWSAIARSSDGGDDGIEWAIARVEVLRDNLPG
jgi:hypothetical protein